MQHEPQNWDMGQLMELATGYWKSAVLSAGVELGVFDALSDGPATAKELAERIGAAHRHLTEILDALVALALLEKDGAEYRLARGPDAWLNRNSSACMLDALRFNMDLYPLWGRLAECARKGEPAIPPGAHLGADPERTRRFALGMHSRALGMAPTLLPAIDLIGVSNLLDIAAGPGTFSRILAEQHDALQVTQFDLPAVLEVARELTADSSAANRIRFQPGDYHTDALPTGFDMALLCGAIHQEDDDFARILFERIKGALNPNGRLLIVDMMLEPERTGPLFSNLFSINMMLTSPNGHVYTAETLEALLQEAGFAAVHLKRPQWSPYRILEAQ